LVISWVSWVILVMVGLDLILVVIRQLDCISWGVLLAVKMTDVISGKAILKCVFRVAYGCVRGWGMTPCSLGVKWSTGWLIGLVNKPGA